LKNKKSKPPLKINRKFSCMQKCQVFTPSSLVTNRGVLSEIIAELISLKNKKILSLIEKSEKKRRSFEKLKCDDTFLVSIRDRFSTRNNMPQDSSTKLAQLQFVWIFGDSNVCKPSTGIIQVNEMFFP
jgi:hypothetical protein